MVSGLVLGENVPEKGRSSNSSNPSQSIGKVDNVPAQEEKAQKPKESEGEQAMDKRKEMDEALREFVIRVAQNRDGRNTEAEVAALPQIAALLYGGRRGQFGTGKWPD